MTQGLDGRLISAIRELEAVFQELKVNAVFIGGVAVSLLATPRATEDVDALIVYDVEDRHILLKGLRERGFRTPLANMDDFVIQTRLVTAVHEATGTVVDIMLGCMPFEEQIVARSSVSSRAELEIRLPTPEDLIVLKALASRPKDLEDIRNIGLVYGKMDRGHIQYWLEQYGKLMETPELWERTKLLLDRRS